MNNIIEENRVELFEALSKLHNISCQLDRAGYSVSLNVKQGRSSGYWLPLGKDPPNIRIRCEEIEIIRLSDDERR